MRAILEKAQMLRANVSKRNVYKFSHTIQIWKKSACHVAIYVQYVKMNLLSKKISTQHMCAKQEICTQKRIRRVDPGRQYGLYRV